MAALTMFTPTLAGTAVTVATASASDTVTQAQLGTQGAILVAITSGTVNAITISDAGASQAGNPATPSSVTLATTGVRAFYISPTQVNLGTGLVTITSSPTTNLTYHLYPA